MKILYSGLIFLLFSCSSIDTKIIRVPDKNNYQKPKQVYLDITMQKGLRRFREKLLYEIRSNFAELGVRVNVNDLDLIRWEKQKPKLTSKDFGNSFFASLSLQSVIKDIEGTTSYKFKALIYDLDTGNKILNVHIYSKSKHNEISSIAAEVAEGFVFKIFREKHSLFYNDARNWVL